jgi:dolichol-phosphate mannosyltransferase
MKKGVVIVPTYNERENIQKVVPILMDVFKKVKHWQMNILVVDDNSPDKTADVVKELQKKNPHLFLLSNPKKSGLGGAYLKGMAKAFGELRADVVFEFDADLSHDPTKIPDFLAKIDDGYDMVLGSRYIPGGAIPQDWGWYRKFLSVFGNMIVMLVLTNFRIRDWTGGYRAITKKVYEDVHSELNSSRFSGYTFQVGFLYKTVKKGFKVTEVPFHFIDRTLGQSKLGNDYIKNILLYIFEVRIQEVLENRIFKFLVVGGIGAVTQLITLQLWRQVTFYELAFFLAIECAVVANFILNNFWTFSDRKPALREYPAKFAQFNLASAGSIIIQQVLAIVGKNMIGIFTLFTLPIIHMHFDTGTLFAVVGILVGMFWNFFAYNKFVWKKSSA